MILSFILEARIEEKFLAHYALLICILMWVDDEFHYVLLLQISHLRSCGVLQESEDALDVRKSQNSSNSQDNPFLRYTEALEQKQRQIEGATTKQLRKCFSGSMVMNESSSYSREA